MGDIWKELKDELLKFKIQIRIEQYAFEIIKHIYEQTDFDLNHGLIQTTEDVFKIIKEKHYV